MDENKPSHLASTAVVSVIFGAVSLLLYSYQVAQLTIGGENLLESLFAAFAQGSLILVTVGLGAVGFILGLIARISTSKGYPDFLPALWSMLLGLILVAGPLLINIVVKLIADFVNSQKLDLQFVMYFTLGLVALILVLILVIIMVSSRVRKSENQGPIIEKRFAKIEKQKIARAEKAAKNTPTVAEPFQEQPLAQQQQQVEQVAPARPAFISQNADGAPEPTPPTNWNGFPNS